MARSETSSKLEIDDALGHNDTGQQGPQNEVNAAVGNDSEQGVKPVKKVTLCGICENTESKYKCPRCYLPYCSVACNKVHRENHPPDPEPAPKSTVEPPPPVNPPTEEPQNPRGRRLKHPFRTLEHSEQLQWLFRKYPRLPDQLLEIHAATQAPPDATSRIPKSLMKDLPPQNNGWNRDKGIARGKAALRRARKAEGEDGEAIREYSELVLHLLEDARSKSGS